MWSLDGSGSRRRPPSDPDQDVVHGEHQLHWVSVPLRTLVITAVFLALPGIAMIGLGVQRVLAMTLMVFAAAGVYCLASWWLTWFRLDADHLMVRSGMLRRTVQEVPLSRLQAVDVVRPFVPQIFGLAELRIELAGGDRGEVRLRFLSAKIATRLRDVLLARAAGLPPLPEAPPERPFYSVPFGLLLAGLAFRVPVLGAFLLFLALVVLGVAFRELGVLGGAIPLLLGLVRGFLGPLLRYASFTAALTPDGLRLRHGVFQRRVQTIPPGRVQAVRIVSPTLWRYLGVVRVEANVAGYVGERQMDSSTLLPVVDRATAFYLIHQLFPGTSAESVPLRPAQRSLSKRDALGVDQTMFVTRYGLMGEILEMVPLARVQSVRMSSGLLARWFGVATVEVDCPPGPARMRANGRGLSEARQVVESVTAGANTARATTAGPERWATRADPD
ncbi:PH domain-containing protein [Spiractinospora alimapuensis]|nr:PH domain-containing protein [Spiractinospora alimapuensis]